MEIPCINKVILSLSYLILFCKPKLNQIIFGYRPHHKLIAFIKLRVCEARPIPFRPYLILEWFSPRTVVPSTPKEFLGGGGREGYGYMKVRARVDLVGSRY